jgi:hypothetical protein
VDSVEGEDARDATGEVQAQAEARRRGGEAVLRAQARDRRAVERLQHADEDESDT